MNKRGEELQLYFTIEIILGILIAGILVNSAVNFDSISKINSIYTQQDLQLLSESLLSAPGGITYTYPIKSSYTVSFADTIKVSHDTNLITSNKEIIFSKEQGSKELGVKNG